jgi:hypothetical protein
VHKKHDIEKFKEMITSEYRVHWLLDNIPVAVRNDELGYVSRGYPVGFLATTPAKKKPQHFLFNHVRIVVRYNENVEETTGATIVGFEVIPFSIKHEYEGLASAFNKDTTTLSTCNQFTPAAFHPDKFQSVERSDEEVHSLFDIVVVSYCSYSNPPFDRLSTRMM